MKLNRSSQSIKTKLNRPEKGGLSRFQRGSFRREGKKEGVWGRNFCLPVSYPFGFAQGSFTRRPRGGGRRGRELPRKLYHLFIFFFKISPNFGIEGQPLKNDSHLCGAFFNLWLDGEKIRGSHRKTK